MEPPVIGKKRIKGVRKRQIAFRAPVQFGELFEKREKQGHSITDVVLQMLQIAKDLEDELGVDFYRAEMESKIENTTTGKILARWAKAGMKKR